MIILSRHHYKLALDAIEDLLWKYELDMDIAAQLDCLYFIIMLDTVYSD